MRLMLKYVPPEQLYGVDPWDKSIEICQGDGVLGQLAVSDYLPETLPFAPVRFDFIYAFSVFTHLSHRATLQALDALRARLQPDGVLLVTVRPVDYWDHHVFPEAERHQREDLKDLHIREGFAFRPHNRKPVDGDITYGDTSMTLDFIEQNWTDWRIADQFTNDIDRFQTLVFLRPR